MSREQVRTLKQATRAGRRPLASEEAALLGRESALRLLARSIDFGHGRLAVMRLAMAVSSGAEIPREHWRYCASIADSSRDRGLQEIYLSAAHQAGVPQITAHTPLTPWPSSSAPRNTTR